MKLNFVLLSSVWSVANAISIPVSNDDMQHQTRGDQWMGHDVLNLDEKTTFRIALKQQNLDKGMDLLMSVSDPASDNYGRHYTAAQVTELFAPSHESVQAVKDWLTQSGIPAKDITLSKSRGWLDFISTLGHMETLVDAKIYRRGNARAYQINSDEYAIPSHISDHIDFIHPALPFNPKKARNNAVTSESTKAKKHVRVSEATLKELSSKSGSNSSLNYCDQYVTPDCISALYNIPPGSLANANNRLGIFELNDEYLNPIDLNVFYGYFAPEIPSGTGPLVHLIDFGSSQPNSSKAVGEAALDFDIAQPILYPQSTVLYQVKTNSDPEKGVIGFLNQFLDAIDGTYCNKSAYGETGDNPAIDGTTPNEACGTFVPTNVISFSYGADESDYPAGYLQRQCDEFMKLGLQGVTVVFASGDGGVAGGHGLDCLGPKGAIFNPQFGASCPYVTAVGATVLPAGGKPGDHEMATTHIASGGGFSNVWTVPSYQKSAVTSYFKSHDPGFPTYNTSKTSEPPTTGNGLYNCVGRGYPDMAAAGQGGVNLFKRYVQTTDGTSMSAPLVAAIFTRINEERLAKGKSPIGFVNPALYANPKMFNDITLGEQGGGIFGTCLNNSFKAVPGWDPVTGLGTPNYPAFKDYFMSLK